MTLLSSFVSLFYNNVITMHLFKRYENVVRKNNSQTCTASRSKIRPVLPVPCKCKEEPCKFLSVKKFAGTITSCATFLFLPHFDPFCDYWTDERQHWMHLVHLKSDLTWKTKLGQFHIVFKTLGYSPKNQVVVCKPLPKPLPRLRSNSVMFSIYHLTKNVILCLRLDP